MGKVRFAGRAALIAAALLLAACSSPDDYPIGLREAYSRLNAVNIPPAGDGVFFRLETTVSGNSADEVTWTARGPHAVYACRIGLEKIDDGRTHVLVDCDGGSPSSGAAAGMTHNLIRNRVIEMVDATLTGRKFNPKLANGVTAARWPGDGVGGSYASAADPANGMDADMRKVVREAEASERERERDLLPERAEPEQSINSQDEPSAL
ncbi:hypothetical protein [Novosphingobium sp. Chol11]|uniref:hypothetical protein n=1 Tax=Novosphingobium sp. Chol11 TaxID=1385763 RepID=UPI0025EF0A01|nr:hypothetical protein [Novosphingobium sp. Chol11]